MPLSFSSAASSVAAITSGDVLLFALWLSIGVAGLAAGAIVVLTANRRFRREMAAVQQGDLRTGAAAQGEGVLASAAA